VAESASWFAFRSCVSMLVGMDNIELYDAAVDGRAEHRKEVV
jgi:hypothetical protein